MLTVIMDMTIPNMTGGKLARSIVKIRSDIPIIICTGFNESIDEEKAIAIGIKGFFMKSVHRSEMARIVREVLEEAHGADQQ